MVCVNNFFISLSLSLSLSLFSQVEGDPRAVKARIIADRLKHIGDDLENQYIKEKLDDITDAIGDVAVMSNNPLQFISYIYTQSDLSWRKVAELFKLFYRVMESSKYDDQFTLFEKAWYGLMDIVVPWIHAQGGWVSSKYTYLLIHTLNSTSTLNLSPSPLTPSPFPIPLPIPHPPPHSPYPSPSPFSPSPFPSPPPTHTQVPTLSNNLCIQLYTSELCKQVMWYWIFLLFV